MIYVINTINNNGVINQLDINDNFEKEVFNIKNIKELSDDNNNFQNKIKDNTKIDGLVFITNDILKNISLNVFLMDINKNMIIVIPNKKEYLKNRKYQNILGVPVVNIPIDIVEKLKLGNNKNTIPHINNLIENSINLVGNELNNDSDFKRYIAMQIIYENPYYQAYLKNTKIKLIKEDLDYNLNNKTISIIDNSTKMIK